MAELQKANLGTPPGGDGGDNQRVANTKFNSNVDILKTQAALASAGPSITVPRTLTVDEHVGRRVGINLANPGTVKLPSAKKCAADQVILLRNFGTTLVTLAVEDGSGDYIGLDRLQPFETVLMDTNGSSGWWVLFRGRASSGNESVVGNLSVGGTLTVTKGVAGDLGASGKLVGVNNPNLLFNGSAEFGVIGGWGPYGFVDAYTGGTAEGTYFSNKVAINSNSYVGSNSIAIGANTPLTLSGEIHAGGVTAGAAWFRMVYLNASGGVLGTSPNITTTNGYGWSFKSDSRMTPAGTASVYVQLGVEGTSVAVVVGGVSWRRLKLEYGSSPSLYSQEATIAYLGGSPAFAGRPTFGGKVPWDSGNMTRPALFSAAGGNTADLNPNAWEVRLSQTFVCGAGGIAMVTATAGLNLATGVSGACDVLARIRVVDGATVVFDGSDDVSTVSGTSDAGLGGRGKIVATGAAAGLTAGKTYTVQFLLRKNQPIGPLYPLNMQLMGITS